MANIRVINFGETVSYRTFKSIHDIGLIKTSSFGGGVVAGDKMCSVKFFVINDQVDFIISVGGRDIVAY